MGGCGGKPKQTQPTPKQLGFTVAIKTKQKTVKHIRNINPEGKSKQTNSRIFPNLPESSRIFTNLHESFSRLLRLLRELSIIFPILPESYRIFPNLSDSE